MRMLMVLLLAGCGGNLEDPGRFTAAQGECDAPALLKAKCTGGACHTAVQPVAQLDLASAGLAMRLFDVPALGCGGGRLIDPADPKQSVVTRRLEASACGSVMPPTGALAAAERACVVSWVESVAAGGTP
jgi:hypothetical protein